MKKIFLSFTEKDFYKVKKLMPELINPEYELDFYDRPLGIDVDSQDAESIKRIIGEKIVKSNITLCLIGESTHRSKWVDLELQKSRNKGNKIIVMALKGIEDAVLPKVIIEENLTLHPWNPQRLAKFIAE